MKKLKTFLFGAGPGAEQYIEKMRDECEFKGVFDNDPEKAGSNFCGLPVHFPHSLSGFDFDQIVITTQWAKAVKSQLIDELGIDPSKVVVPRKSLLKKNFMPFSDSKNLELAENLILGISDLSIKRAVPLVIDFGTLLGIVRENGLIPWDDDIDFSAPLEYSDQVEQIFVQYIRENPEIDWRLSKGKDRQGRVTGLWLGFYTQESGRESFLASVGFREVVDGVAVHMPSLGMWFAPNLHFDKFEKVGWAGGFVQVPYNHEDYLEFVYGDWRKPKKGTDFCGYNHIKEVSFDEIKTAHHSVEFVDFGDS